MIGGTTLLNIIRKTQKNSFHYAQICLFLHLKIVLSENFPKSKWNENEDSLFHEQLGLDWVFKIIFLLLIQAWESD